MNAKDLTAESFERYPPQGRALAVQHLNTLRQLPMALLPVVLLQIIEYDWRFPAERLRIRSQLEYARELAPSDLHDLISLFLTLQIPDELISMDWINQPRRFSERLTAMLWSTHQIDAYRKAALHYEEKASGGIPEDKPVTARLVIVVIGQGVQDSNKRLFRPLRPHGTMFTAVRPEGGLNTLVEAVRLRAKNHPEAYAHWYVDGGKDSISSPGVVSMSYAQLAPAAWKELQLVHTYVARGGDGSPAGVEAVTSYVAGLRPSDLGIGSMSKDPVLSHFQSSVLTEGSGTQIFSTTFVQWSAREILRRAQPLTLMTRYAPRQVAASMETMLQRNPATQATDVEGSLVDADMAGYYTWINLTRLSGAGQSRFLVWFEDHNLALAISPSLARNTTSSASTTLQQILNWMD